MFFIKRKIRYFVLIVFLGTTIWVWFVIFGQTSGNILKVAFFDIGQGDAIFIETPNQVQVLIDGGPDKAVLEKLNQEMPFYDRTIDLLILTHPDADHITGLVEVLKYYQVGHILSSGFEKETIIYQKWRDLIKQKNIPLTIAQAGQRIILEQEVVMKIFWPDQLLIKSFSKNTNNVSVVAKLVYGQIEFLLTGDIEKEIEQQSVSGNWQLESDILKVPHHGSKTSSSYNFLKAVNPQIAVISVGENNRFKHPSSEVLERLKDVLVYRTDKNGNIKVFTDGIYFEIETEQ